MQQDADDSHPKRPPSTLVGWSKRARHNQAEETPPAAGGELIPVQRPPPPSSEPKMYDENQHLKFGFLYWIDEKGEHRPYCMVCRGKGPKANQMLRVFHLRKHHMKQHKDHNHMSDEDAHEFFHQMRIGFKWPLRLPSIYFCLTTTSNKKITFMVSYKLIKANLPYTAGAVCKEIAELLVVERIGEKHRKAITGCCFGRTNLKDCAVIMSKNIEQTIVQEMKDSPYPISVQLDETTDINKRVQLGLCARWLVKDHVDGVGYVVKEDMVFCQHSGGKTSAESYDHFSFYCDLKGISKDNIGSLATDGAPSMMGKENGFGALLQEDISNRKI